MCFKTNQQKTFIKIYTVSFICISIFLFQVATRSITRLSAPLGWFSTCRDEFIFVFALFIRWHCFAIAIDLVLWLGVDWFIGVGNTPMGPAPPQLKCYKCKNVTKKTIVSFVSVSFSIFAYNSTCVLQ